MYYKKLSKYADLIKPTHHKVNFSYKMAKVSITFLMSGYCWGILH